jgi:hypothetical protein
MLLGVRRPLEIVNAISYPLRRRVLHVGRLSVPLSPFLGPVSLPCPVEQARDVAEGADVLMVKPALPYLDVIADASEIAKDHPIACYQVSGEFAMIHAGAKAGVYDLRNMAVETTESMVRAGTSSTWFDRFELCL